jgi:predicted signal transduction protein with EAL and GGDEF domain
LSEAAQRLVESIRETDSVGVAQANSEDMVARLGGDEFTVLLRDVLDPRDAAVVATRMLKALARPFIIEMHELVVTASIGIAMYPVDGDDGDALMKAADAGMYQAKNLGRNNAQFYSAELNTSAFEKLSLENELHLAVKTPPWVLHYQPKVDITTGSIAGVEALIRWKHPKWGVVPPSRFIPVAEEIGLISAIGDWVLEEACRQAAEWKQAGLGEINIAVNLASPSFRKATLVSGLAKLINQYSIRPAQLQIEATESMLMEHAGLTINTLKELNKLGVKLSIDDFGTGYSSLSYLRRFPVDQLKIDRSFVTEMTNNADDAAITAAIISLGRDMKREIVAEGVETMAQARLLRQQGCKLVQGYLFSHAIPAAEMSEMLRFDRPFAAVIADLGLALAVGHS